MAGREGDLPLPKLERLSTRDDATGDDASNFAREKSSSFDDTFPPYPARRSVLLFCFGSAKENKERAVTLWCPQRRGWTQSVD